MNIIICGAGRVGYSISNQLSKQGHSITVIDKVSADIQKINDNLDARGVVDSSKIRTIYKSQTFPTTGYAHAHNLHPAVVAKVKQAFYTYNWDNSTLDKEFNPSLPANGSFKGTSSSS